MKEDMSHLSRKYTLLYSYQPMFSLCPVKKEILATFVTIQIQIYSDQTFHDKFSKHGIKWPFLCAKENLGWLQSPVTKYFFFSYPI